MPLITVSCGERAVVMVRQALTSATHHGHCLWWRTGSCHGETDLDQCHSSRSWSLVENGSCHGETGLDQCYGDTHHGHLCGERAVVMVTQALTSATHHGHGLWWRTGSCYGDTGLDQRHSSRSWSLVENGQLLW